MGVVFPEGTANKDFAQHHRALTYIHLLKNIFLFSLAGFKGNLSLLDISISSRGQKRKWKLKASHSFHSAAHAGRVEKAFRRREQPVTASLFWVFQHTLFRVSALIPSTLDVEGGVKLFFPI